MFNMTQAEQNFNENNMPNNAAVSEMTEILTLFRQMEFSIKQHMIKSEWSIVYIEEHTL